MYSLQNGRVRIAFDDTGNLTELANLESGTNYAGGRSVYRLYFENEDHIQNEIEASHTIPEITVSDQKIVMIYSGLNWKGDTLAITLRISIELEGDETRWTAELSNQEPGILLKECQLPLLGACGIKDTQSYITTAYGGQRFPDARERIVSVWKNTQQPFQSQDHLGIQIRSLYPGLDASMNCFVFADDEEGLYLASHDPSFQLTGHLLRLVNHQDLEAGFVKYPFLQTGESAVIPDFVISPYIGTWHTAARKYQAWTKTWYKKPEVPAWLQGINGWQRIILEHQNGDIHYTYDQLPEIRNDGQEAGIQTLFMFGWWRGGMDHRYPEYACDERLGGEAALKENVKRFQQDGGNVILYSSGRLVDKKTEFYKKHGDKVSIKTRGGSEVRDSYHFNNTSTFERNFGNVELVSACLTCVEWVRELERMADLAYEYGCKSIFYDQLGSSEYPCCDPSHGHPIPFVHQFQDKIKVLRHLREYIKRRDSEMGFGIEIFSDVTAQFADYIHGVYHGIYFALNDWERLQEKPKVTGFIEWMRYIFPDLIFSDRDIRDDTDIERRVNLTVLLGLRNDVEIYRCRKTIKETPHYKQYLKQVNELRSRNWKLLMEGTFKDTEGLFYDNKEIDVKSFEYKNRKAVVLAQSHLNRASTTIYVPGYAYDSFDGVGSVSVRLDNGLPRVSLGKHGLAVVIFHSVIE